MSFQVILPFLLFLLVSVVLPDLQSVLYVLLLKRQDGGEFSLLDFLSLSIGLCIPTLILVESILSLFSEGPIGLTVDTLVLQSTTLLLIVLGADTHEFPHPEQGDTIVGPDSLAGEVLVLEVVEHLFA